MAKSKLYYHQVEKQKKGRVIAGKWCDPQKLDCISHPVTYSGKMPRIKAKRAYMGS